MSTTMLKKDDIVRKWYVIDAAGKPLGKTAALAADLLRGKLKVDYTPHVDCGDYVIVINAEKAVLTGKKLEQKYYRTHSATPAACTRPRYDRLMKQRPRARHEARRPRHASEEHHRRLAAHPPARVPRRGAHPRGPEARSLRPLREVKYNGYL